MRHDPDAIELLRLARQDLLDSLVARLPATARYSALLVAHAIGVAAREIEAGSVPLVAEYRRLQVLYAQPVNDFQDDDALKEALTRLNCRLCADIRAGRFDEDDGRRDMLQQHLRSLAIDTLRESNPKYLQAQGVKAEDA